MTASPPYLMAVPVPGTNPPGEPEPPPAVAVFRAIGTLLDLDQILDRRAGGPKQCPATGIGDRDSSQRIFDQGAARPRSGRLICEDVRRPVGGDSCGGRSRSHGGICRIEPMAVTWVGVAVGMGRQLRHAERLRT